MIKAPFNFVPLSDEVFFPEWASQISHDIPFEDGVSGTINLKITAHSPIFVRNGHSKKDGEEQTERYKKFSSAPDGRFFIPATSIKGAVRNVLEIMSFGKMRLDKRAKFAQREWDNEDLYTLKNLNTQKTIRCGYLKRNEEGQYCIEDHGVPYRIGQERIDEYLGEKLFETHFSREKNVKTVLADLNKPVKEDGKEFDPKTAAYKYHLLSEFEEGVLENLQFDFDEEMCDENRVNRLKTVKNGEFRGDIVLTGQPDKWLSRLKKTGDLPKSAGKYFEFVFLSEVEKTYNLSEDDFDHYKFIYADSPDWQLAKNFIDKKGIPVFFRLQGGKIKDFGLALLYKLPYDNTPYETLSKKHHEEKSDLADCIFGKIESDAKNSLRGRVQFTAAFSDNATEGSEVRLVLGSPKASYYPIYVSQRNGNGNGKVTRYSSYNDSTIAGWKRYQVRKGVWNAKTGSDKLDTLLLPVKEGAVFESKVKFFNLNPVELGALLSALTFHGTEGCFHQIGQGKPYGYGKTTFEVSAEGIDVKYYMARFEQCMEEGNADAGWRGVRNWASCDEVEQLITMAHTEVNAEDVLYKYMTLDTKGTNDFISVKQMTEYLREFTAVSKARYSAKSLYAEYKEQFDRAAEAAEAARKEAAQQAAELLRVQQEKEERDRREQQASLGLKVLNEQNEQGAYRVAKWDEKRILQMMKKFGWGDKVPDEQLPAFLEYAKRVKETIKPRDVEGVKKFIQKNFNNPDSIIAQIAL